MLISLLNLVVRVNKPFLVRGKNLVSQFMVCLVRILQILGKLLSILTLAAQHHPPSLLAKWLHKWVSVFKKTSVPVRAFRLNKLVVNIFSMIKTIN